MQNDPVYGVTQQKGVLKAVVYYRKCKYAFKQDYTIDEVNRLYDGLVKWLN